MSKLVRDKIPKIIESKGEKPSFHIADNEEYWEGLRLKLKEEVNEFLESKSDKEIKEELADILEVINGVCEFKGIDKEKLENLRREKSEERGKFEKRIILDYH